MLLLLPLLLAPFLLALFFFPLAFIPPPVAGVLVGDALALVLKASNPDMMAGFWTWKYAVAFSTHCLVYSCHCFFSSSAWMLAPILSRIDPRMVPSRLVSVTYVPIFALSAALDDVDTGPEFGAVPGGVGAELLGAGVLVVPELTVPDVPAALTVPDVPAVFGGLFCGAFPDVVELFCFAGLFELFCFAGLFELLCFAAFDGPLGVLSAAAALALALA